MSDWLTRLLPWYDEENQVKKERKTEATKIQAQRAIKRSDAVIQSYRAYQEVIKR